MQQVGDQQRSGAAIAAVQPGMQLPARLRAGHARVLIIVRRTWILHRASLTRLIAALVVALALAGGFQARGGIAQAVLGLGDLLAGRFAQIGFGIEEISITGQVMTKESDIAAALAIGANTSSFNFDVEAARQRLIELPAIADAQVRKVYPSRLVVEVSEVAPIARWRVDGVTFVIDAAGVQIADATVADESLPLIIGDGAADDAQVIIQALESFPVLKQGLLATSRIGDRRWDLIYETGLRVQLPENGLSAALQGLSKAQSEQQLLDRDLVLIDMRVAGLVALRPAERKE